MPSTKCKETAAAQAAVQAEVDMLSTQNEVELAIYDVRHAKTGTWNDATLPLLLAHGAQLNRAGVRKRLELFGDSKTSSEEEAINSANAWVDMQLGGYTTLEEAQEKGYIQPVEEVAKGHQVPTVGSVVAVAAPGMAAVAKEGQKISAPKKRKPKKKAQKGGKAPKVNLDDLDAVLEEWKTLDKKAMEEADKVQEATVGQAVKILEPNVAESFEGEEAPVVAPVQTKKIGGTKPAVGTKSRAVSRGQAAQSRAVSRGQAAQKLAAAKAGTHLKAKPSNMGIAATTTTTTTTTPNAIVATSNGLNHATCTRATKTGSGVLDTLASSASGVEGRHRSTGSTVGNASYAAAAVPKERGDKGETRQLAPSGAGATEDGVNDERVVSKQDVDDGALSQTENVTFKPQQQQQQQQEEAVDADSTAAVAKEGDDDKDPQAALKVGNFPIVENDDNEEETTGRATLCSSLTKCALNFATKVPIFGAVVGVCAEIVIIVGELLSEDGNTCPDQPSTTSDHVLGEQFLVDEDAMDAVLKFQAAEAEQAMILVPSFIASSIASSDTTKSPPLDPSDAEVGATSSIVNVMEAVGQFDGAPSPSPPSPSPPSPPTSPSSLLACATSVVLFPGRCAVGIGMESVKAAGKTVRKGMGLIDRKVVGSVKGMGRALGVGFGVVKGLGLAVWRVLRGMRMGFRRCVKILLGGRWSEEVEEEVIGRGGIDELVGMVGG